MGSPVYFGNGDTSESEPVDSLLAQFMNHIDQRDRLLDIGLWQDAVSVKKSRRPSARCNI